MKNTVKVNPYAPKWDQASYDQTCKEVDRKFAEIDAKYPINPEDPPEVQAKNRVERELAKDW